MAFVSNPSLKYYNLFDGKPQCFLIMRNFISAKHVHKETEIAFPLNGDIEVIVQDRRFHVAMHELLVIPSNAMHHYLPTQGNIDVINVKFMEEWLVPPFFDTEELSMLHVFFHTVTRISANPVISGILGDMQRAPKTTFTEYHYFGKIIELVSLCLQNPHWIAEQASTNSDSIRYTEDALRYIQENCCFKLTLKMLADHLGLTQSYCSKYFKKNIGTTFMEYLTSRRVSNAERLLKYTSYSITEVAEYSGFSSIQTFNRVFKQLTGLTPTEYRQH